VFLTLDKAEELNARITEIYEEKSALEEQHFGMMSKYRATQLNMDEALARAENAQDLLDTLQRSKQSDISDRMIALSDKLQSMKLGEMRATRELAEVKEKNNYISRLLRTSSD
jgi:vacuolar-type H+-ATPase subunit I/STV1